MTTSINDSDAANWSARAQAVRWNVRPFIDGDYQDSVATDTYSKINPATEEALCDASIGHSHDVERAVASARRCVTSGAWSDVSPSERGEFLVRVADLMIEHKDELALLDCLEVGKPIQSALWDVGTYSKEMLKSWATAADQLVGESLPMTSGLAAFNSHEPRGVVAAITAWNFPVVNAIFKIGPALAAGNAVVLKPSELSPSSALRLAELAIEAGLPAGALNVVPGIGSTVGEALAVHSDVDFLSFTGSTGTARRIMEASGRSNAKPLLLECGGKSPQVVFADVESLEVVAAAILEEALYNSGQVCSSHSRVIVDRDVKDDLLDLLLAGAERYRPASPLDDVTTFGPLASPGQRDRVKRYIQLGRDAGAHVALQGIVQESGGCYVSPTIFDRVTADMTIAREEIFGPVLSILTFDSEEEAIALANGTDYALAATVWSRDIGRIKRTARGIKAGSVTVRTALPEDPEPDFRTFCVLGSEPQGASGFGVEVGRRALEAYSNLKAIYMNGG